MPITDRLVFRKMRKIAKKIADMFASDLPRIQKANPDLPLHEQLFRVYTDKPLSELSPQAQEIVRSKATSVHGFCYMMAMDIGPLNGWMTFRLLQFTNIMDEELEKVGYERPTREEKTRLVELFDLSKGDDYWKTIVFG